MSEELKDLQKIRFLRSRFFKNLAKENKKRWGHVGFSDDELRLAVFLPRQEMRNLLQVGDESQFLRLWYKGVVPKNMQDSTEADIFSAVARVRDEEGFVLEKGEEILSGEDSQTKSFGSVKNLKKYLKSNTQHMEI